MSSVQTITHINCETLKVSAYVEGDLSPHDELAFELHLASCTDCTLKLNHHKNFLNLLNSSLLADDGPELPPEFTRKIVAKAESGVSGLRDKNESRTAFLIIGSLTALAFAILLASGQLGIIAETIGLFESLSAIFGAATHFLYSIGLSMSVVVKTLTQDVPLGLSFFLFVAFGFAFLFTLTTLLRSRRN